MSEPDEIDVYDQEVERELIRKANEQRAYLERLREPLEQIRQAAERLKKASER